MAEYYTPKQIAEKLNVHPRTIRRWIREGRLRAIQPGPRTYRIAKEDFESFLEERRTNRID